MTSPRARSAATASRTTVRLTPMPLIISCSEGSFAPAGNFPETICSAKRSTTSALRLLGVVSGRSRLLRWRRAASIEGVLDESCLVIVQVTLLCSRRTSNGGGDFRDLAACRPLAACNAELCFGESSLKTGQKMTSHQLGEESDEA